MKSIMLTGIFMLGLTAMTPAVAPGQIFSNM